MRTIFFFLSIFFIYLNSFPFTSEIKTIRLNDGENITARLCLPDTTVETIIFCIPGTGAHTYLTQRPGFIYLDEVANGFCEQGLAFFSYNRRGCELGETSPLFVDIDTIKFAKYNPLQEAEDIEVMISSLLDDPRFKQCKIVLYGISEGTIIAPLVAERNKVKTDALLLHGYAHENMYDVIKWQNEGHGIMILANSYFDKDGDKAISKEEYENPDERAIPYKSYLFHDLPFNTLDVVSDGVIDIKDRLYLRTDIAPYDGIVIGGGAEIIQVAGQYGQLLYVSEPNYNTVTKKFTGWVAQGKAHGEKSSASLKIYVISIKETIPGFGKLQFKNEWTVKRQPSPINTGVYSATITAPAGWAVTSGGGSAYQTTLSNGKNGSGRLLTCLKPTPNSFISTSSDHIYQDRTSTDTSVSIISIRKDRGTTP